MSHASGSGESVELLLGRVADEFTQRQQQGEQPDIEEYARRYPQIADVIRQVFPALQTMRNLGGSGAGSSDPIGPDGSVHGVLGDFRIRHEIGRGGMGIVYEAEQISLGRRVALKVLPFAAVLDPRQLQRFRNEAQAAAQLHHTNIVPVYTVGSERGVYFFAMQYIEGRTLADVIEELRTLSALDRGETPDIQPPVSEVTSALVCGPGGSDNSRLTGLPTDRPAATDASSEIRTTLSGGGSIRSRTFFRNIAGLGVQAAQALDHAHQLGVIHRDIKPSNLLLDARGNVWVTDFGLASVRSPDQALTMPGDVVGTLRYMSPEQAQGESALADRRADVYSLGATLYELVTLHPAFGGRNRHEVLRRIIEQPPPPPHRLNEAIPPDLETILLKAMAKEPAERYASAAQLGEDLRRFQEHRPILARPPTSLERLAKWSRRHTALVGTALAALLLIVVGLAIGTVLIAREERRTASALSLAREQRERSDGHLQDALGAVDRMLTQVGQDQMAKVSLTVRRQWLTDALQFYRGFLREQSGQSQRLLETARTYRRIGDIQRMLADHGQAEQAYRQGVRLLTGSAQAPREADYRYELAICQRRLSSLLRELKRAGEAQAPLDQATMVLAGLVADVPADAQYWQELAAAYLDGNQLAPAEEALRKAMALRQQASGGVGADRAGQEALAEANHSLGHVLQQARQFTRAGSAYAAALDLYERLAAQWPGSSRYQGQIGQLHFHVGETLQQEGQLEQAEAPLRQAVEILKKAAEESPDLLSADSPYQNLLRTYPVLADVLTRTDRWPEGLGMLREGLAMHARLIQESAHVPGLQESILASREPFDHWVVDTGIYSLLDPQQDSVVQALQMSVDVVRRIIAQSPNRPEYREQLGRMLLSLHFAAKRAGDIHRALGLVGEALDLYEQLANEYPNVPRYREYLAVSVRVKAQICDYDSNRSAEAEKGYRRAIELWRQLQAEPGLRERYWTYPIYDLKPLAALLYRQGRLGEAEQVLREIMDLNEPVMAHGVERLSSPNYSLHIIDAWFVMADLLGATGRLAEAEGFCAKAAWFAHDRVSTLKDPMRFGALEAEAYQRQARLLLKLQRRDEAGRALAQAAAVRKDLLALLVGTGQASASQPADRTSRLAQMLSLQMTGAAQLWEMRQLEAAAAATAEVVDAMERLTGDLDATDGAMSLSYDSYNTLAESLVREGRAAQAERLMRYVDVLMNRSPNTGPPEREPTAGWIRTCWQLALELEQAGQAGQAEQAFAQGLRAAGQLASRRPGDPRWRSPLWAVRRVMAQFLVRQGRFEEAGVACREALATLEPAVTANPAGSSLRWVRLNLHVSQADVLSCTGHNQQAEELYRESIDQALVLVADAKTTGGRQQLAKHYATFGEHWARAGAWDEAIRMYQQAVEMWNEVVAQEPEVPAHRVQLATCRQRLAELSRRAGRADDAVEQYRQALHLVETLEQDATLLPPEQKTIAAIRAACSQVAPPAPADTATSQPAG